MKHKQFELRTGNDNKWTRLARTKLKKKKKRDQTPENKKRQKYFSCPCNLAPEGTAPEGIKLKGLNIC